MGLFQCTRMPFGLTGTPSSFQRSMNKIFHNLHFVTTYLDDILVHSANEEQCKYTVQQVFQKLEESSLTLGGKMSFWYDPGLLFNTSFFSQWNDDRFTEC